MEHVAAHLLNGPQKKGSGDEGSDLFALEVDEEAGAPLTPQPTHEQHPLVGEVCGGGAAGAARLGSETPIERKVIVALEEEANVCSICLDEFEEDPAALTRCGHGYHLQCIMQWAQRSRECPLCFRSLQLEDESLNELLPFGEYVSPQQQASAAALLESWELERFLLRLAAAEQRGAERAHRRTPPRPGTSAPQPIRRASGGAAERPSGGDAAHLTPPPAGAARGEPPAGFPASWPPAGTGSSGSGSSSGGGGGPPGARRASVDHGAASPGGARAAAQSLKTRLASLRLKESFSKTTKELRSLFGGQ